MLSGVDYLGRSRVVENILASWVTELDDTLPYLQGVH
jgi:hypothetical protein